MMKTKIEYGKKQFLTAEGKLINIEDSIEYEIDKTTTIVAGDKIYIDEKCKIPRFKLRPYCKDNDIKIVNKVEEANKVILCNNTIDSKMCFNAKGYNIYVIDKEDLIDLVNSKENPFVTIDTASFKDIVYVDSYWRNIGGRHFPIGVQQIMRYYSHKTIEDKDKEYLANLLQKECVHEDAITKLVSECSQSIMEEKDYISIQRLFNSSDKSDHNLACEALCNYQYDESAAYLLLLIIEFKEIIRHCKISSTVNFRALLNYFQVTLNQDMRIDTVLHKLDHQSLLNTKQIEILYPYLIEEYNTKLNTKYFTISSLEPSTLMINALNKTKEPILEPEE